jgi:hypothetical protein
MGKGVLHVVGGYFLIFNLTNVNELYVPQDFFDCLGLIHQKLNVMIHKELVK